MKYAFVVLLISFICLVTPLQAEIYKWTDEQGRVHFSDKPADNDTPPYPLRIPAAASGGTPDGGTPTDAERRIKQRKLMESLETERLEKEQAAAKQRQQRAMRDRKCQYARAELRASKEANLIYDYDAKGNKVYLNETQKQKYFESKYAAVQKWCD
ncbi:MAG: DUF4124 domain-containing protein [Gammaproteobacteria bacterium]